MNNGLKPLLCILSGLVMISCSAVNQNKNSEEIKKDGHSLKGELPVQKGLNFVDTEMLEPDPGHSTEEVGAGSTSESGTESGTQKGNSSSGETSEVCPVEAENCVYFAGQVMTQEEYDKYKIIQTIMAGVVLPEDTGGGFYGNLIGDPKCPVVFECIREATDAALVSLMMEEGMNFDDVFPVTISEGGWPIEHIYQGIGMLGPDGEVILITWTDPWDGYDDFYTPGSGRNDPSDLVEKQIIVLPRDNQEPESDMDTNTDTDMRMGSDMSTGM
jgi:hypothetical protein